MSDTPSSARLSALIVARNEAANLPDCLASVAFADEIVVVLDRSTDASAEIARAAGAVLVEGGWDLEGPRRRAGIEACAGPWILEVDADERVTPALAAEIRDAIAASAPGRMLIPFLNFIGGVAVRHGWGAYNGVAAKWCLFAKGCKIWGDQRVHPAVRYSGIEHRLTQPMHHHVYRDTADMWARLDRYARLAAEDAVAQGKVPGLARSVRRIFTRFFKVYVRRQGWREGPYGIALGVFAAVYPILVWIKAHTDVPRQAEADPNRKELRS